MKNKKILLLIIAIAVILISSSNVCAWQVSRNNTSPAIEDADDNYMTMDKWLLAIRQMENSGAGMGLNETVNATSLLTDGESNNIDIHMLKNTEYGATLIFGVSNFGSGINPYQSTLAKATTTGNAYGVYELGYKITGGNAISATNTEEMVAAVENITYTTEINSRYLNRYERSGAQAMSGDALKIGIWFGTDTNEFNGISAIGKAAGLVRGNDARKPFSFTSGRSDVAARPAIVNGEGF